MSWPIRLVVGAVVAAILWIFGYCYWLGGLETPDEGRVAGEAGVSGAPAALVGASPGALSERSDSAASPALPGRTAARTVRSSRNRTEEREWSGLVKLYRFAIGLEQEVDASWTKWLSKEHYQNLYGSAYDAVRAKVTLGLLRHVLGTPLYLSGPHGDSWDRYNRSSFGHYNPAAIRKMEAAFDHFNSDPVARGAGGVYYRFKLRERMLNLWHANQVLKHNPIFAQNLTDIYRTQIQDPRGFSTCWHLSRDQKKLIGIIARQSPEINKWRVQSALSFWLRRRIDGSHLAFDQALNNMIETYDPRIADDLSVRYDFEAFAEELAVIKLRQLPHFVIQGDTVEYIAEIYGSRAEWIRQANDEATDDELLKPGNRIKVPFEDLDD